MPNISSLFYVKNPKNSSPFATKNPKTSSPFYVKKLNALSNSTLFGFLTPPPFRPKYPTQFGMSLNTEKLKFSTQYPSKELYVEYVMGASVHVLIQENSTYIQTVKRSIYDTRKPKHPH